MQHMLGCPLCKRHFLLKEKQSWPETSMALMKIRKTRALSRMLGAGWSVFDPGGSLDSNQSIDSIRVIVILKLNNGTKWIASIDF